MTLVYDNVEGDWAAVYVDGVLKHEGHSISERDLLAAAGIEADFIYDASAQATGRFPHRLEEVERV